jgi:MOSC domain-containing protein YiiM
LCSSWLKPEAAPFRGAMLLTGTLVSVNVGLPKTMMQPEPWTSSIFKEPVAGPVALGLTNLEGDRQSDLSVHGGRDKAVCVYSADHIDAWRRELNEPAWGVAAAGENFTVAGLTETTVCLGDVFEVGTAVVQISQPRSPCSKFARKWGRLDLPKRVIASGRTGWYFRVLTPGHVEAGQPIVLRERPHAQWTITRVNGVYYAPTAKRDAAARAELAACAALSEAWRAPLRQRDLPL